MSQDESLFKLLNETEWKKVKALQYLQNHPNTSLSELATSLDFSNHTSKKIITDLQSDILAFNLESSFSLHFENNLVTLVSPPHKNIIIWLRHYVRNSIEYKLLEACFLMTHDNIDDFADEYFISPTSVYRVRKKLENILEKYQITISTNLRFEGQEVSIRSFLFEMYFKFFGENLPFDCETNAAIEEGIARIENIIGGPKFKFTQVQKIKVKYVYYIVFTRMAQGKNPSQQLQTDPRFKKILMRWPEHTIDGLSNAILAKFPNLPEEDAKLESYMMLRYLYSEAMLPDSPEWDAIVLENTVISNLNNLFINEFGRYFKLDATKSETIFSKTVCDSLSRLHSRLYFFEYTNADYIFDPSDTIALHQYNDYMQFASQMTNIITPSFSHNRKRVTSNQAGIMYDYLFLMMTTIPLELVNPPFHVVFEFSQGANFDLLVKSLFKDRPNANIVVERHITENTLLFVSDINVQDLDVPFQLQWHMPPTAADWSALENILAIPVTT